MGDILTIIILTLTPFLELRASIPYGIFETNLSLVTIFLLAVITNILLAPIIYLFLDQLIPFFLKVKIINQYYQKIIFRSQRKVHRYVEKYGVFGLALFIGVPLPGSGVYSGTLGAYLLGFKFKDFFKAVIMGVLIAGTIVLIISLVGDSAWNIFLKYN